MDEPWEVEASHGDQNRVHVPVGSRAVFDDLEQLVGGYLWLNDATSPEGAQEFAVVRKAGPNGCPWQVESTTVSWCDYAELLAYVERTLRGKDDQNDFSHEVAPALQTPAEHGRCCHCA